MKLSGKTITRIAAELTESKKKEANKKVVALENDLLHKVFKAVLPEDLAAAVTKYPSFFRKMYGLNLSKVHIVVRDHDIPSGHFVQGDKTVPAQELYEKYIEENCSEEIEALVKLKNQRTEIDELEANIRCILETHATDKKIKKEFPEAYEVYLRISNLVPCSVKDETLCDKTEEIRAKLSSK